MRSIVEISGGLTDCAVLVVEPNKRLSYSWNASGQEAATGPKTVVTWARTPTKGGTLVRMEQSGFRPEDEDFYRGASYGWQQMVGDLEQVVAELDGKCSRCPAKTQIEVISTVRY